MMKFQVKYNSNSLYWVGVEILDKDRVHLRCMICGQVWSPSIRPGGRLPRGWWKCLNFESHVAAVGDKYDPIYPRGWWHELIPKK